MGLAVARGIEVVLVEACSSSEPVAVVLVQNCGVVVEILEVRSCEGGSLSFDHFDEH